jgi:hypothetical protein
VTPTVEDDTAAKGGDEMPVFFVPGMSREEAEKAYENFPRPQYPQVHSTARRSKMDIEALQWLSKRHARPPDRRRSTQTSEGPAGQ